MTEDATHAKALRSEHAWCGQRITQKPMWQARKSEVENRGGSSQTSGREGNTYRPYRLL